MQISGFTSHLTVRFPPVVGNSSSRTADTPYRYIHWHASESSYGHSCPSRHGKSLDPHWQPRSAGGLPDKQVTARSANSPGSPPGELASLQLSRLSRALLHATGRL